MAKTFNFQQFSLTRVHAGMKLSTDAVLLGTWTAKLFPNASNVLDIGTGTGILSLLYAQFNPQSHITGLDLEDGAIKDANLNFKNSPFSSRLTTLHRDLLCISTADLPNSSPTDLIICNPPYFPEHNNSGCNEKSRYTARHNNTLCLPALFKKAHELLNSNGYMTLMLPISEQELLLRLSSQIGFRVIKHQLISSTSEKPPYLVLLGVQKVSKDKIQQDALANSSSDLKNCVHSYLFEANATVDNRPVKSAFWAELTKEVYLKQ